MGGCLSSPTEGSNNQVAVAAEGASPVPEGKLGFDAMGKGKTAKEARLLLLGPGESGKSTFFKQLQILQGNFQNPDARSQWKMAIRHNIRGQMKVLVQATLREDVDVTPEHKELMERVIMTQDSAIWNDEETQLMDTLWKLPVIQLVYGERDRLFILNDGAKYLLDNVVRIGSESYVPTVEDILSTRIRTAAFAQAVYSYNNVTFKVWDIGGQIPERRKWRRHLMASTGLIFFASLVEYDQRMREDTARNRMEDTLELFEELRSSEETQGKYMILMLNKLDLFVEKLPRKPLSSFFPAFKGTTWEEGAEFIKQQFVARNKRGDYLYVHLLTAINTRTVDSIWKSTREVLLEKATENVVATMM